jgi:hypothetical protein
MNQESIDYYRRREQAERKAVHKASCVQARWAHQQMALAYARLVELEELKAAGAIPPGKVVALAAAMRARDDADYARRGSPRSDAPAGRLRSIYAP